MLPEVLPEALPEVLLTVLQAVPLEVLLEVLPEVLPEVRFYGELIDYFTGTMNPQSKAPQHLSLF